MLQSTPMLSRQDNANPRACQRATPFPVWTHTGMVETEPIIAAVARAYTAAYYLADDVTPAAILGPGRATHVAHARHLCAYLLVEDYHLSYIAAAQALGRTNHTTIMNSRARVAAALDHDDALRQTLADVRAILGGRAQLGCSRPNRDGENRWLPAVAAASPRELAEYRYWRLRASRSRDLLTVGVYDAL
jgi:hypothetical protein